MAYSTLAVVLRAQNGGATPKIKDIAIGSQDPDKIAKFYIDVFGRRDIAEIESAAAGGYHRTDGDIKLAILKFKNDKTSDSPADKMYTGLHRIGFEADTLAEIDKKLSAARAPISNDINDALGLSKELASHINTEAKYSVSDGVIIDFSETRWAGTMGHPHRDIDTAIKQSTLRCKFSGEFIGLGYSTLVD